MVRITNVYVDSGERTPEYLLTVIEFLQNVFLAFLDHVCTRYDHSHANKFQGTSY